MSLNLENMIISPLVSYGKVMNGSELYGKSSQAMDIKTTNIYMYRSLNSQAPSTLTSRNKFIDLFPRDIKGLLRRMYIEATLTNSGSSSIQLIPYYFMFDYITLYSGNKVIAIWYANDLYQVNNFRKTDYEAVGEQALQNISESTYSYYNSTLAAGASTNIRIDISHMISSFSGLLIDGFIEDFRIEFNTRPVGDACTAATSSSANVACTSWAIDYGFELLSEEDYIVRYNAHRMNNFIYKYVEPIQHISAFPAISSNIQYTDTMKDINAKVHAMIFALRTQGAIHEQLVTFYPLTLLYLKNDQNRIWGDQEWTTSFVNQAALEHFPLNFYLSRQNVYPWVFSRSILNVLESGISIGALLFTGMSESFWFSASGSLSSVNCEMVITALIESHLIVNHGQSNVSRITGY